MRIYFADTTDFNNLVSLRDGIQLYNPSELGIDQSGVIKVYRPTEEVKKVVDKLSDIPITIEHVDLKKEITDSVGTIIDSELIENKDTSTKSTIGIKNKVKLNKNGKELKDKYKELSLGYTADFIPSDNKEYDFYIENIQPHHLAMVERGRCGTECSFVDKKTVDDNFIGGKNKVFNSKKEVSDEELNTNEQFKIVSEKLDTVISYMKKNESKDKHKEEEDVSDEKMEKEDSKNKSVGDMDVLKKEIISQYKNSECFKDAVAKEAFKRMKIIDKASSYIKVDASKSSSDIQRAVFDTLEKDISNEELDLAFEILDKKQASMEVEIKDTKDVRNSSFYKSIVNRGE